MYVQLSLKLLTGVTSNSLMMKYFFQEISRIFRSPLLSTQKQTEPNEVNEIQRSPSIRATRILATISLFEYCKKPPISFLPPTFSTRTFPSSKHFSTKKNPRKYQKFDWAKEREKRNVAARMHVEF